MCGIVKPGPNGTIDTGVPLDQPLNEFSNLLVPAGSGQKIEVTDSLNPDTDGDEVEEASSASSTRARTIRRIPGSAVTPIRTD